MNNVKISDMYFKNIFEINYEKLKKLGIKTLIFDLDNTIVEPLNIKLTSKLKDLFDKIKKDFKCIVLSNTIKKNKIKMVCIFLDLEYIYFAIKPTSFGFNRAKKKYKFENNKVCVIGDQYFTDICLSKRVGCYVVLVDRIGDKEGFYTKINRKREDKKYRKINFKRGSYYD